MPNIDDWTYRIHEGDCLDVMSRMPADSVDLIVTSPPYAMARKKTYGGIPHEEYVDWFMPRAEQMMRILKPTGSFVLNIKENVKDGERTTYVLELILAMKRAGWRWVDEYMWHKTCMTPGKWPNRLKDGFERCYHFSIMPQFKMRQDSVKVPMSDSMRQKSLNSNFKDYREKSATGSGANINYSSFVGMETVYPSNVLHFAAVSYNSGHPAAYPEEIPAFFVKLFTDEGDVVLDPFSGSGTTYDVAQRAGRKPIGIEIKPEYIRQPDRLLF